LLPQAAANATLTPPNAPVRTTARLPARRRMNWCQYALCSISPSLTYFFGLRIPRGRSPTIALSPLRCFQRRKPVRHRPSCTRTWCPVATRSAYPGGIGGCRDRTTYVIPGAWKAAEQYRGGVAIAGRRCHVHTHRAVEDKVAIGRSGVHRAPILVARHRLVAECRLDHCVVPSLSRPRPGGREPANYCHSLEYLSDDYTGRAQPPIPSAERSRLKAGCGEPRETTDLWSQRSLRLVTRWFLFGLLKYVPRW
jgi:hypothetical protein